MLAQIEDQVYELLQTTQDIQARMEEYLSFMAVEPPVMSAAQEGNTPVTSPARMLVLSDRIKMVQHHLHHLMMLQQLQMDVVGVVTLNTKDSAGMPSRLGVHG